MEIDARAPKSYIAGPDGNVLTEANLPSSDTVRWVPRRKAELIAAVRGGMLSMGQVCERYGLSSEEFLAWQDALNRFGLKGLRATGPRYDRRPSNARSGRSHPEPACGNCGAAGSG